MIRRRQIGAITHTRIGPLTVVRFGMARSFVIGAVALGHADHAATLRIGRLCVEYQDGRKHNSLWASPRGLTVACRHWYFQIAWDNKERA